MEEGFRSMALSGGSTPKIWFDLLSETFQQRLPWSELLCFWGDERCVPPTHAESNYKMTTEHLLGKVPVPEGHIFRILGEQPPVEEALRYSRVLEDALPESNGLPRFDLVVLGMGDDGHTASLVPGDPVVEIEDRLVAITDTYRGHRRMTLTRPAIDGAGLILWIVSGSDKAEMIDRLVAGDTSIPAGVISQERAVLVTDVT